MENTLINEQQPSPDILFQAITRRSTDEQMDNENFEVLGDSFLKLAVSMSLYYRHPSADSGLLTATRSKQISNENLYRLAMQRHLKNYLNVNRVIFRGKDANWLPPGYVIDEANLTLKQRYYQQNAKKKAFSDMIEAFIGAFLISSNYTTTIKFIHWLGIDVVPVNEQAYLIAAFTHTSNSANRIADCYERLEFLGDAILEFLVTRHIFVNYNKIITPGRVTDIRQDLLNNDRLAYILVACSFHTKILHNSPELFDEISSYVGNEDFFPKNQSTDQYLNKNLDRWADSTAPKALADVFEALVGAIFIDSGNSLETVWQVIEPLLRKYLDRSISQPNLNPIRSFSEHGGKVIDCRESTDKDGDKPMAVCIVQMLDGAKVEGRGLSKKIAKANACREAMKHQHHNEYLYQSTT
ncbi:unnamed protein product [Rotaria sp. Silwood2]|nr:unnamed protein product [Rotaria sp. Silwood2]CAF4425950.1 unnamed protein product [Rotaria sp. Silwood2]